MGQELEPVRPGGLTAGQPLDLPSILQVAKVLAASGYFPTAKSEAQAAAKIMFGQELGLTPMASMIGIHVWQDKAGRPTVTLEAETTSFLLKRAGYRWRFLEHTDKVCRVVVTGPGDEGELGEVEYTVEEATRAGLTRKDNWAGYAKDMLWARCAARIRRRYGAEVARGLPFEIVSQEELDNEPAPRERIVQLLTSYAERFPKWPGEEPEEQRARRLRWSEAMLEREIRTWNELTVAEHRILAAELERVPRPGGAGELTAAEIDAAHDPGKDPFDGISGDGPGSSPGVVRPSPEQSSAGGGRSSGTPQPPPAERVAEEAGGTGQGDRAPGGTSSVIREAQRVAEATRKRSAGLSSEGSGSSPGDDRPAEQLDLLARYPKWDDETIEQYARRLEAAARVHGVEVPAVAPDPSDAVDTAGERPAPAGREFPPAAAPNGRRIDQLPAELRALVVGRFKREDTSEEQAEMIAEGALRTLYRVKHVEGGFVPDHEPMIREAMAL